MAKNYNEVYSKVKEFKRKYPMTIAWRLKAHSKLVSRYIGEDEEVLYAFACQNNHFSYEIFMTYVVVLTSERIILAQKRLFFGSFFKSITPDMYNDLTIKTGIIWGKLCIDTIKEVVQLSNLDKGSLPELESTITTFMLDAKKQYPDVDNK